MQNLSLSLSHTRARIRKNYLIMIHVPIRLETWVHQIHICKAHNWNPRKDGPFMDVAKCPKIPPKLECSNSLKGCLNSKLILSSGKKASLRFLGQIPIPQSPNRHWSPSDQWSEPWTNGPICFRDKGRILRVLEEVHFTSDSDQAQ